MGKIVISTNVSLDGVVQDPDGQEGFALGGWFGAYGGKDLEDWSKLALDEGTLVVFDARAAAPPIEDRTRFEVRETASGRKVTLLLA